MFGKKVEHFPTFPFRLSQFSQIQFISSQVLASNLFADNWFIVPTNAALGGGVRHPPAPPPLLGAAPAQLTPYPIYFYIAERKIYLHIHENVHYEKNFRICKIALTTAEFVSNIPREDAINSYVSPHKPPTRHW